MSEKASIIRSEGGNSTLSAVRVVFSLWLAAAHSFHSFSITDPVALWMKQTSFLATDTFIIMSAVTLSLRYAGGVPGGFSAWSSFMYRRISRIWPVHALVLVVMWIVTMITLDPTQMVDLGAWGWSWLCQFTLVQAWNVPSDWTLWNSPTWTLSALVGCYAIYPFLSRFAARIGRPRVLLACALALYGLVWFAADQFRLLGFGGLLSLPQQIGVVRAVPIFILGVLVVPVVTWAPAIPKSRLLDVMAKNTYCVYVIHWPILKAMEQMGCHGWQYSVLALLIILVTSHIVRSLVEDPIQRLLRRPKAAPAPVVTGEVSRSFQR
jgi:peptidoglycan/LPS O-acetylase OafA/YrhL